MHAARLIPTTGVTSAKEAEQRAASAFLAVLTIVRDLSLALLCPLGASKARRAVVEAFTETMFKDGKRTVRPDGLVRVTYGSKMWTALFEIKTGEDLLDAEQLNCYWDVARANRFDHIVTISNELSTRPRSSSH